MQNSKPDEKLLPSTLQKVLQSSLLANYLQKFSYIKTYREANQGKQLLQLIQASTSGSASTKVIKKLFTFFKHAQAEGKVCMMQFLKELIEIDNVWVYVEIEKHLPSIFCEICDYRTHIKNIGRGSSYFMKEQSLHQKVDKFNEIVKLSNTYFRMIHEMLYVWGQFYFPSSRYSTLYQKIAERSTFPQYPSQFKFYSTQKIQKISKLLVQINKHIISQKAKQEKQEEKGGSTALKIRSSKREKSEELRKNEEEQEFKELNKQKVEVKVEEIVEKQKKEQKIKSESQQDNIQIQMLEMYGKKDQQQEIDEIELLRNSTKSTSQFISQSKHKKLKKQGRKPIPPNVIYRESSIQDPVDMTKNIAKITKYSSPANINMTPKKVTLQVPMGMIEEKSSQSKTTPTATQPKKTSRQDKMQNNKSLKQQTIIQECLSEERQMYECDSSQIEDSERGKPEKNPERSKVNVKQINLSNLLSSSNQISEEISRNYEMSQKEDDEEIVPETSITYSQLLKKQKESQDTHRSKTNIKKEHSVLCTDNFTFSKLIRKEKQSIQERETQIEQKKLEKMNQNDEKEIKRMNKQIPKQIKKGDDEDEDEDERKEIRNSSQKSSKLQQQENSRIAKKSQKMKNIENLKKQSSTDNHQKREGRRQKQKSLKQMRNGQNEDKIKKIGQRKSQNYQEIMHKHQKMSFRNLRKHNQFSLAFYPPRPHKSENQQNSPQLKEVNEKFSKIQGQIATCNSKMEEIKGIVVSELKQIKQIKTLSNLPIASSRKIYESQTGPQNLQIYSLASQLKNNPPQTTFRKKGGSSLQIPKQFDRDKEGSEIDVYAHERNIKLFSMTEKLGSTLLKSKHNSVKKTNMRMKKQQRFQDCQYEEGTMLAILSKRRKSIFT